MTIAKSMGQSNQKSDNSSLHKPMKSALSIGCRPNTNIDMDAMARL